MTSKRKFSGSVLLSVFTCGIASGTLVSAKAASGALNESASKNKVNVKESKLSDQSEAEKAIDPAGNVVNGTEGNVKNINGGAEEVVCAAVASKKGSNFVFTDGNVTNLKQGNVLAKTGLAVAGVGSAAGTLVAVKEAFFGAVDNEKAASSSEENLGNCPGKPENKGNFDASSNEGEKTLGQDKNSLMFYLVLGGIALIIVVVVVVIVVVVIVCSLRRRRAEREKLAREDKEKLEKNKEEIKSKWKEKFPGRNDSSELDTLFQKDGFDLGVSLAFSLALLGLLENEKFDVSAAETVLNLLNDSFYNKKMLLLFTMIGNSVFYVYDGFIELLSSAGKGVSQLFKQKNFTTERPLPNFFTLIHKVSENDENYGTKAFEGLKRVLGNEHFTYWSAYAITYMLRDRDGGGFYKYSHGKVIDGEMVENFVLLLDKIGKYENDEMAKNLLLALELGKLTAKDFEGNLDDCYFELDIFADCLVAENFNPEKFMEEYNQKKLVYHEEGEKNDYEN